jgi:heptosyltransferase I
MIAPPKRVLFVRMDRIGDLVLTLPTDQNPIFKDSEKLWFISKGLEFVPENAVPPRHYVAWKKEFSWLQFFLFIKKVREFAPKISVSFQSPWWVTLALWLAGVPERVGVLSSWHSFLFLNYGLRQKRSQCKAHELDYNHQLIQKTLTTRSATESSYLKMVGPVFKSELPQSYIVIHPGMAGSALNWPLSHYRNLILSLSQKIPVIITGTATDRPVLGPLHDALPTRENILWFNERLNPQQLLGVLQNAKAVFAPSTGVIHLAASLGVPTRGIYSPVTVQKAERWGPRGPHTHTWTPEVNCPGHFRCLGRACKHYNCMELVSPQEIEDNISKLI